MALYGELKVNAKVIGYWAAVRKEEVSPGRFRYETTLDISGQPRQKGSLEHDFADGAAILAGRVLLSARRAETLTYQSGQPSTEHDE